MVPVLAATTNQALSGGAAGDGRKEREAVYWSIGVRWRGGAVGELVS